jgi:hypothetical protein
LAVAKKKTKVGLKAVVCFWRYVCHNKTITLSACLHGNNMWFVKIAYTKQTLYKSVGHFCAPPPPPNVGLLSSATRIVMLKKDKAAMQ